MTKPPIKPPARRTKFVGVQFYTDPETVAALQSYLASLPPHERPTKRAVIEAGLHGFLRSKGFWPPVKNGGKP